MPTEPELRPVRSKTFSACTAGGPITAVETRTDRIDRSFSATGISLSAVVRALSLPGPCCDNRPRERTPYRLNGIPVSLSLRQAACRTPLNRPACATPPPKEKRREPGAVGVESCGKLLLTTPRHTEGQTTGVMPLEISLCKTQYDGGTLGTAHNCTLFEIPGAA
jgi:hypothetical protein